jgi:hypothetical protein
MNEEDFTRLEEFRQFRKEVRVCDKFVGKPVKRTPDSPRNPPSGC